MFNIQFEKIDHGIGTANRYEVKLSSLANPEAPRENWMTTPSVGGNDQLNGGSGDDWLFGANLTMASLEGLGPGHFAQWSDDCYLFVQGDGQDLVADGGGQDRLVLENVRAEQLWFSQSGNDLDVSAIGSQDHITLQNWYLGNPYHVEQFETSDGKTLLDSQVQNLVNAMASFAPPAAGQTTLAANYAAALTPVIVANWQ